MTQPPTEQALASKLGQLNVMIADGDRRIAKLVKEVLQSIGFRNIYIVGDGSEGVHVLKMHPIDFVITDWRMEPVDGIDFVRYIRTSPDSPNKRMPIIMMTANVKIPQVETARDAGVTEMIVKPFTTKALFDRIVQVVDNPRGFVLTPGFTGPDRRRRRAPTPPEGNEDRRNPEQPRLKMFLSKAEEEQLAEDPNAVHVLAPDYDLKRKIGDEVDVKDLLKPGIVRKTQRLINEAQREFLSWINEDFTLLEQSFAAALKDPKKSAAHLRRIQQIAFTFMSEAGIFGFSLASEVGRSLYEYCEDHTQADAAFELVVRQHIDALRGILQLQIEGTGGQIGKDLLKGLETLVKKFH